MTTETPKRLLQVIPSKYVHLPAQLLTHQRGAKRIWLHPGDVIDATDPFVSLCIAGQEYKFKPAPDGSTISERFDHPLVRSFRRALANKKPAKADPKREGARKAAEDQGLIATGAIPAPDLPSPTEPVADEEYDDDELTLDVEPTTAPTNSKNRKK